MMVRIVTVFFMMVRFRFMTAMIMFVPLVVFFTMLFTAVMICSVVMITVIAYAGVFDSSRPLPEIAKRVFLGLAAPSHLAPMALPLRSQKTTIKFRLS